MKDKEILEDILETEKNMVVNLATALNEASCKELYDKIFEMFTDVSNMQKNLFTIAYNKGWYQLEEEQENKVCEKYNKLKKELDSL